MASSNSQLFYNAFRTSPIGIAIEDLEGRPLFVNPALCSMLGFTEDELLNKHCVDFSPAEDAEKDLALFQQLKSGAINYYSLDKRYFRRDGSLVWGRLSISIIRSSESPLVVAMVADITDKKLAEENLIRAEHDLDVVTREMAAAAARCSRDLRYVWANQGYADLLRLPLNEIVGRPILEVLDADTFEIVRPYFEQVLAGETVNYEREVRYRDAEFKWISATFTPTFTAGGEVDGWVAVIVDITGRKRTEEAIRESESRFRRIVETTNEGVWLLDATLHNLYVNRQLAEMLGYETPEMIGRSVFEFYFPDDFANKTEILKRRQQGRSEHLEERLRRKDGSELWVRMSATPMFKESGEFDGALAMVEDITQRKLAEEALSKVSQKLIQAQELERSRLARELHDNINQRLSLLAVTLGESKKLSSKEDDQVRTQISDAVEQVADIAKDIQALSHRLHSPKLELLGLSSASSSFCKEFSLRHSVEVGFQSAELPRSLPDDISLSLYRVLQEALQNAVKHSGARHFGVSLTSETDEIELTVQDAGIGFDPDEAIKSTGLGLASMKERMKLVGGEISIASQLRQGTTIRARVPFQRKSRAATASGSA